MHNKGAPCFLMELPLRFGGNCQNFPHILCSNSTCKLIWVIHVGNMEGQEEAVCKGKEGKGHTGGPEESGGA
jgi:hypothetical protein